MLNLSILSENLKLSARAFEKINKMLDGGTYLIEARTGWGKTTLGILLSIFLVEDHKILFFTRTNSQVEEIYSKYISYLEKYHKDKWKIVVPVLGKDYMCPYSDVDHIRGPYQFCKYLRKENNCLPFKKFISSNPNKYLKYFYNNKKLDNLILNLLGEGLCPYYEIKSMIPHANIILSTYYYLFNIPKFISLKPYKYIVIVDEAHNLPEYFTSNFIIAIPKRYIRCIINYMKKEDKKLYIKYGENIDKLISEKKRIASTNRKDIDIIAGIIFYIQDIVKFTEDICENHFTEYIFDLDPRHLSYARKIVTDNKYIYLEFSYSPEKIRNLFKYSYLNIFLSATLSPKGLYVRFISNLMKKKKIKVIYGLEKEKVKIKAYFIRGFSSRYIDRTRSLYETLARGIYYITSIFGPGVIFAVSNEYIEKILEEASSIKNFKLYSDIEEFSNKLKKIDNERIGLILAFRGRYSEGINKLRLINIKNVIITGLPIPPPSLYREMLVKIAYKYDIRNKKLLYRYGYLHAGATYMVQAVGRIIKSDVKSIRVFIFEDRVKDIINSHLIPTWFKDSLIIRNLDYIKLMKTCKAE